MKLEFSRQIFETTENFMETCPVGAELFLADGPTDRTELAVTLRNFSNAPKILVLFLRLETQMR